MSAPRLTAVRPILALVSLTIMAAALPACSQVQQSLGLGKNPPDEFKIVSRAPLTIPPEFDLPPPQPGKPRPQELQPQQDAEAAMFGAPLATVGKDEFTPGEEAIMMTASVEDALPDIRDTVDEEHDEMLADRSWIDEAMFWKDVPDPTAVLIDPNKETERLQNNAALGLPANAGDFEGVIVVPREQGILEGIF
jgi:Protein of unknown function (DUF3035)